MYEEGCLKWRMVCKRVLMELHKLLCLFVKYRSNSNRVFEGVGIVGCRFHMCVNRADKLWSVRRDWSNLDAEIYSSNDT